MSATPDAAPPPEMKSLEHIEVSKIDRNPANPRLHFPEEEIERLTESIAKEGILVPVVVYPENGTYRLIDGERRWLCAQNLGLETIPSVITNPPNPEENLLWMFNIHMVREPWQDMPTAWALEKVIAETGTEGDRDLADLTGLSVERIRRLRHALDLPPEYQEFIELGQIPLNFFWELKQNVIEPLAKRRPSVWEEFDDGEVLTAFVNKRIRGVVKSAVSLRDVHAIISMAEREVADPSEPSVLDDTLRQLVRDDDMTIDEAYQDTVEVVVETDKLERRTSNIVKAFDRLLSKARSKEETDYVKRVGRSLVERLGRLFD